MVPPRAEADAAGGVSARPHAVHRGSTGTDDPDRGGPAEAGRSGQRGARGASPPWAVIAVQDGLDSGQGRMLA